MNKKHIYHLPEIVTEATPIVLLPGDPERVDLLLSRLERPIILGQRREFRIGRGEIDGVPIMIVSTGIGGPSTAIAVQELHYLGAHTLIRVGTAGSLSPQVRVGDIILASAAIRDEGTSVQYLPIEFPAIPTPQVIETMKKGLTSSSSKVPLHVGVVHSKDAFFAQKVPQDLPLNELHRARYHAFARGGVLASEMECATLFIVGQSLRCRTGAILQVMSSPFEPLASRPTFDTYLDSVADSVRSLIHADLKGGTANVL